MASIPEDLIKDAPTFPEFLAWYTKDRAREKAEYEERQKAYEERQKQWRAEYEERQRAYEERQKQLQEARAREDEARAREKAEYEERQRALDAAMATMSKKIGDLGSSVGELVETLVAARLWEKFPEYGLREAYQRYPVYNEKGEVKTEIDILLVNGEWAMVVEVKRTVKVADVEHHVERMARVLRYPPAQLRIAPKIKLLGAIAGGTVQPDAKERAHECGFFVLELAGESVVRAAEPEGFRPKEWRA
jgi:uncharacterized protein YukE